MSVVAAAASAVGLLIAVPVGSGADSASRIVDRTVVCKTTGTGYPDPVRYIDVAAAPRLGENAPSVSVYNLPALSGVRVEFHTGRSYGSQAGHALLGVTRCKATTLRIPLTSGRLAGGETALGERYKCDVPAQILVRVKATFKRPVALRRARSEVLIATGDIATAALAVAALRGSTPIVYAASDDRSGKTRIFVSRSACVPNR